MQIWTYPDHHPPGDGPWRDEPDKLQWVDEKTDLDCLAKRGPSGAWCGYVGVPPGHPWHGKPYMDVDVDVHGGLTYSDRCQEEIEDGWAICHVPEPGRPTDVWWLGFDCAHAFDQLPRYAKEPWFPDCHTEYRDMDYVVGETRSLAAQVADVNRK